jgi:hypothetical protein
MTCRVTLRPGSARVGITWWAGSVTAVSRASGTSMLGQVSSTLIVNSFPVGYVMICPLGRHVIAVGKEMYVEYCREYH